MDLPVKVANPARGQLNREKINIFLSPFAPSRPASACSFSTLRLNLVLTHGIKWLEHYYSIVVSKAKKKSVVLFCIARHFLERKVEL